MSNEPTTFTIDLSPGVAVPVAVHEALTALAEALAAEEDEVSGYGLQRPGLTIGLERPGTGPFLPQQSDQLFCLGWSIGGSNDPDKNGSCTIRIP